MLHLHKRLSQYYMQEKVIKIPSRTVAHLYPNIGVKGEKHQDKKLSRITERREGFILMAEKNVASQSKTKEYDGKEHKKVQQIYGNTADRTRHQSHPRLEVKTLEQTKYENNYCANATYDLSSK